MLFEAMCPAREGKEPASPSPHRLQPSRMTVGEREIEKLHRLPATKNLGFESATGIFRHKPTNRTAYVPCGESERERERKRERENDQATLSDGLTFDNGRFCLSV